MIGEFGGTFFQAGQNLRDPGLLELLLEQIQGPIFGHDPYPTVVEKAAAIGWKINKNHIFRDGNKRTAMKACDSFLRLNGYVMRIDSEVVEVALKVANGDIEFSEFVVWLRDRTTEV